MKQINITNRVNRWWWVLDEAELCGEAVVWGCRGGQTVALCYSASNKSMSHVRAKASTSLFPCLINETVSRFHRCPQSSLPPGWPFNIRSKRRLSSYRHVSTRQGRFKVNSREVDVTRRDNSALIIRFINVSINRRKG